MSAETVDLLRQLLDVQREQLNCLRLRRRPRQRRPLARLPQPLARGVPRPVRHLPQGAAGPRADLRQARLRADRAPLQQRQRRAGQRFLPAGVPRPLRHAPGTAGHNHQPRRAARRGRAKASRRSRSRTATPGGGFIASRSDQSKAGAALTIAEGISAGRRACPGGPHGGDKPRRSPGASQHSSITRPASRVYCYNNRPLIDHPGDAPMRRLFLALPVLCLAVAAGRADDWPQWLGPKRDGVWRETGILDKFPTGGPKVLWRAGRRRRLRRAGRRRRQGLRHRPRPRPRAPAPRQPVRQDGVPGKRTHLCLDDDDRQAAVEARVRLRVPGQLRRRPAAHAGRRRRQGLHARARWATCSASTPTRATSSGRKDLPNDYKGSARRPRAVGLRGHSAARRRQAHLPGRRRGQRRRRLRQEDRQGDVAGADRPRRGRLLPADDLRAGRQAAAHHLAPRGGQRPRPRDGQGALVARRSRSRPA